MWNFLWCEWARSVTHHGPRLMINTGNITCAVSRYHCMPHLASTLLENSYVIKAGETVYIKVGSGGWPGPGYPGVPQQVAGWLQGSRSVEIWMLAASHGAQMLFRQVPPIPGGFTAIKKNQFLDGWWYLNLWNVCGNPGQAGGRLEDHTLAPKEKMMNVSIELLISK